MVVGLGNDFPMKCVVSRNVDPAIVPDKSVIHLHAMVMVERAGDGVIPEVNVSGRGFDASMVGMIMALKCSGDRTTTWSLSSCP